MSTTRDHSAIELGALPASELVQQVIDRWPGEDRFDARAALRVHPKLLADRSAVVTLALEEFFRLQDQGAAVSADRFAQKFPEVRSSLRWHLALHSQLCADTERLSEFLAIDWPAPGDVVAGWQIESELGRGGFSRVYLAREERIGGRPVVVKFSNSSRDEAACVGRLDHPGIIRVLSVQAVNGLTAIAMPFLGRATLLDVIDLAFKDADGRLNHAAFQEAVAVSQAAMPQASFSSLTASLPMTLDHVENVLHVGQRLCESLAYAHAQGVLHCDIKPSNVLIAATGAPILLDFNLAVTSDLDRLSLGGTLPYMSPEHLGSSLQGKQEAPLDGRSDVFSLGVTLYQLLAGSVPFEAPADGGDLRAAALQMQQAHESGFVSLRRRNPAVPPRTAELIERCLSLQPDQRPASMTELSAALGQLLREQQPLGFLRWPRQRRARRLLVAATITASILAAVVMLWKPDSSNSTLSARAEGTARLPAATPVAMPSPFDVALQELDRENFQEALTLLERLDERDSPDVLALRASCCSYLKRWSDAAILYEKALNSGCDTLAVRNNLGFCYLRMPQPDFDAARDMLISATKMDPSAAMPWANLAYLDTVFATRDHRIPQLELIATALELKPDDAAILAAAVRVHAHATTLAHQFEPAREAEIKAAFVRLLGRALEAGHSTRLIEEVRPHCTGVAAELDDLASAYASHSNAPVSARHAQLLPIR